MTVSQRLTLFRMLDGLVTLYKPPNISVDNLVSYMKRTLSEDFNALPDAPAKMRTVVCPRYGGSTATIAVSSPDLMNSKLVVGRSFCPSDFMIYPIDPLADMASGVQVFGIGENGVFQQATHFERYRYLKTYHLTGMFGRASVDGTPLSSSLLRSSWRHVTRRKLDRIVAGLQAQFRSSSLLHAGLRQNTQATYSSLAGRTVGRDLRALTSANRAPDLPEHEHLLPPWERSISLGARTCRIQIAETRSDDNERREMAPCVHSLRCLHFDPPYFTLELQVSHETFSFFINMVTNLGPRLRSCSLLTGARRVRHGCITTEQALLFKHCRVPAILADRLSNYVRLERNIDWDEPHDHCSSQSKMLDYLVSLDTLSPNVFTNLRVCSRLNASHDNREADDHHLLSSLRSVN